ncbi:MAG: hypothetical protein H7X70_06670 [Candidatus Kapabacteria bacterium]|nr:hypothetical protein [Candidatus Kapabacteria bacterium]
MIVLLFSFAVTHGQQLGDVSGRNLILNDGGLAGTTKNTILIAPQGAATQLLSYSILLPSSPAPAVNAVLQVSAIAGTTATLIWTVAPTLDLPIVFEEQALASLNIRRRTPFISGVQGIPGGGAFDAQSTRALATQTASAKYSGILTGENNTASGDYSLTLGGSTNISSLAYAIVGNGDQNTASGNYSAILTGTLNVASNSYSTILNGNSNLASGQGSLILMGSGNIVSGDLSAVVIGRNNTIAGAGSVTLSGGGHSIVGDNSVVLGGRGVTVNSSNTLVWNGAMAAFAVTAGNTAFFHNADVILTNGNGASTRLMFLEPNAILTYPAAGANFAAFKAGVMAADNVYTLPTAVGTVGQVLKITTVAGTDATTEWQNDLGGPVIQNFLVIGPAVIAINASVTYLRITSIVGPGAAPVTFVPPAFYSDGTILVVRIIGAAPGNGVSFVDGAGAPNEFQLSGNFLPQADDTITLVWDATTTTWLEVSRRNN